ncbi:hypothetical protein LCGC14_2939530, partial [marine sediment metagenome]
ATGKIELVDISFDAEDICFDLNGLAYLRNDKEVVRYDPRSWREVPWDYGEQRQAVGFSASRDGRRAPAAGALPVPGHRSFSFWHLGGIAISAYLAEVPGVQTLLLIDPFKIGLPALAAFLTIIGYSLNDTIVVFDRIREVRGKAPRLTEEMVNTSINQTLSRTLLTSITTLLVVGILYAFGGQGIHGFAFALVIGVLVGTYSSIFVASPALLWMSRPAETK